jgi:hypothetical protein
MRERHGTFGLSDFFMLLAVVLFFLATLGAAIARTTPWPWWSSLLISAGLFCWSLSTVLPA